MEAAEAAREEEEGKRFAAEERVKRYTAGMEDRGKSDKKQIQELNHRLAALHQVNEQMRTRLEAMRNLKLEHRKRFKELDERFKKQQRLMESSVYLVRHSCSVTHSLDAVFTLRPCCALLFCCFAFLPFPCASLVDHGSWGNKCSAKSFAWAPLKRSAPPELSVPAPLTAFFSGSALASVLALQTGISWLSRARITTDPASQSPTR